jgi:hypothetical protein
MPQFGGKDSKRHFTVVMGGKEHGLYVSSSPSSAAKKAVTKLCAANKSKKVEFHIREITQGSKKKTYGPYSGHIEKLKDPIELKGRVVKYKPVAKIAGKKSEMKGGVSESSRSVLDKRYLDNRAIVKRFENFKVKNQAIPDPFHYKERFTQTNTLYFGIEHLLEINGQKYYPFSIQSITNYPYIRFLISGNDYNLIKDNNIVTGFKNIDIYKHRGPYDWESHITLSDNIIIQFYRSSLLDLLERLYNKILSININFIPKYVIFLIGLIEKYSTSLRSIIDLINESEYKIEDVDKNLIVITQKNLEINLKNLNDKIISIKKNNEQKFYNEEHKRELNIKFGIEFEEKIKEIISRDDTNQDMKKLLQEIIDLTVKNENTKKGMYFNKNNTKWKYHNEAYQFIHSQIKNEYIDLKNKDQERDSIDIIKELLNKYINTLTFLKEKNTERSLFTKNNKNISLFISQKKEANSARSKAEYNAEYKKLYQAWGEEGYKGPEPIY